MSLIARRLQKAVQLLKELSPPPYLLLGRLPRFEMFRLAKRPCPVADPALEDDLISAMKVLRKQLNITQVSVCSTCPLVGSCPRKNQPPNKDSAFSLPDLQRVLIASPAQSSQLARLALKVCDSIEGMAQQTQSQRTAFQNSQLNLQTKKKQSQAKHIQKQAELAKIRQLFKANQAAKPKQGGQSRSARRQTQKKDDGPLKELKEQLQKQRGRALKR